MCGYGQGRIIDWLDNVQKSDGRPRKRRLSSASLPLRKRRRLPTPAMSTSSRTPSKRKCQPEDNDETPRPMRRPSSSSNILRSEASASRSTTTTTSSARSPVKSMGDLTFSGNFATTPLHEILTKSSSILGTLDGVLKALPTAARERIFPSHIRAIIEQLPEFSLLGVSDASYFDDTRLPFDIEREFADARDILKYANKCDASHASEAAWNSMVHVGILKVALRNNEDVDYVEVTQARVYPKDLISTMPTPWAQAKMVDFAMFRRIDENWPQLGRLRAAMEAERGEVKCVNATSYEPVQSHPIAVSIETKTPSTSDRSKAEAQLSVWTAFQIRRFQQLAPKSSPPNLPAVLALGHHWKLYFVVPDKDQSGKFKLYGPHSIGDSESLFGVYTLLRSLRVLANWAATDFDKWWDEALPPANESS